ncbi:MAG TPA: glycosyltransferase family 4 protein [Chloroflexota bacterium]|nr:glycosyltransferase family 4 protein [Chloroflexota bacterium]
MARLRLGVVSTFPPREDGIATFTRDLLDAVCHAQSEIEARIAAITDLGSYYNYPRQVQWEIEQSDPESYAEGGRTLSRSRAAVVSIQHEFGLFGVWGDPLQDYTPMLLDALDKPILTTLHTVLPQPRADIRDAVRRLCAASAATVVMVNVGAKILVEDYDVDAARLVMIPHGVPAVPAADRARVKRALRLQDRTVICTFGLLSRGKAIENVIRALPEVVERYPEVIYLVMGETHPQVRKHEGESYREELIALARELGVSKYVRFVNEYLAQNSLVRYLQATDIYITPYRDRNQITSGTLSYALGVGCAIVSTPYVYASEVLAEGRGLLAEFDNPDSMARCILLYLDDPTFRRNTEERAREYGQEMAWPRVGERYADLIHRVAEGKPVAE